MDTTYYSPGMELDTSMTGLEPGDDVRFVPGPCVISEIQRPQPGQISEYKRIMIAQSEVDDWIEERGQFAQPPAGPETNSFACTVPTALDSDGNYLSSGETLELALSQESFTRFTQRYHLSTHVLDAWRYRSSAGCGARNVEYDDQTGAITAISFVIAIRLSGSFASVFGIHHSLVRRRTVVLALRVSPYDQDLLQKSLELHQDLIGHPLLVPTVFIEISLTTNMLYMQKIRHELSVVEKATGQHGWLQIPATDAPAHDSELSRLGHAAKIHISLSHRRLDAIKAWMQLIKQTRDDFAAAITDSFGSVAGPVSAYAQWMGNIDVMINFRQVDLAYNERRADNQITAIYGLLTQRDNMVGVSVAIESKKISEASKRDGSSLKSLTVLTAVFFPATYIATLFTMPTFVRSPFWLYWAIVIPLTLVIFGSWSGWTMFRQRQIAKETTNRDIDRDVKLDPERAFPSSGLDPPASSFLASTLRQIRSHTNHLHHSTSPPGSPGKDQKLKVPGSGRGGS